MNQTNYKNTSYQAQINKEKLHKNQAREERLEKRQKAIWDSITRKKSELKKLAQSTQKEIERISREIAQKEAEQRKLERIENMVEVASEGISGGVVKKYNQEIESLTKNLQKKVDEFQTEIKAYNANSEHKIDAAEAIDVALGVLVGGTLIIKEVASKINRKLDSNNKEKQKLEKNHRKEVQTKEIEKKHKKSRSLINRGR